jgi:hypothetical protein
LYRADPDSSDVTTCRLAFTPSVTRPAGIDTCERHKVPLPVSLRGRENSVILKLVVTFDPIPRFTKIQVQGW